MNEWLRRDVVMKGIRVGRVVDVILEAESRAPIGFEVRCEDGRHRFLPKAATTSTDSHLEIDSPLALLDTEQLEFYRARGVTLRGRQEPAA